MSASITTMPGSAEPRTAGRNATGSLAGWFQRARTAAAASASFAPRRTEDERVFATAWPVRRDAEQTMYRCRMWDGLRVSEPFFVHAEHSFLRADPEFVLATLAAGNEDAHDILRRAQMRGFTVEFNQEQHGSPVVAGALNRAGSGMAEPAAAS